MSVVALSDLLFADLLTETNMKPWWEKGRGYFLTSSMALALSATYLTLNGVPVNCLPAENGNMSFTRNFKTLEGAWINTYCSNNMPWYFSYLGPMCLAAALFLLVASSLWLHVPAVIDSIVTFSKMTKIITDTDMTLEEMKQMYCQPLESHEKTDKQSKLRKVCVEFYEGERDLKLASVYQMRNCILIVFSIIFGSFFGVIAHWMISHGDRFQCNITSEDIEHSNSCRRFPESFVCVTAVTRRLIIFNIVFLISMFAQIVPIFLGMLKWICREKIVHGFDNADFMIYFWKSGQPSRSKTFLSMIKHVSGVALHDIEKKLCEAILIEDHDLLHNYTKLANTDNSLTLKYGQPPIDDNERRNPGELIMTKISEIYQSKLEGKFPNNTEELTKIENAIVATICKHVTNLTLVDRYKPILKKASVERRWKLFVGIFNEWKCKLFGWDYNRDGYDLLTDLEVECDILDDNGCSLLHYLLDKPDMKRIASLVTKHYSDMGLKLYAHSRGKSSLVKITENTDGLTKGRNNRSLPSGQMKMKMYYNNDFRDISDPPNASAIEELNRRLSLIKFHKFDSDIEKFAKVTRNNPMLWSTFFTILNCYIIPENAEEVIVPLPCEGTNSYMLWRSFISSPLPKPFVSTAAKYILTCLKTSEIVKAIKEIKEINGRGDMEDADRDELVQFIDKSCNNATPSDAHKSDENTLDLSVATADNATSSISSGQCTTTTEESCAIDMEKEPLVHYNSQ